jgi:tRNA(fMet)-specific endonuclease VapC
VSRYCLDTVAYSHFKRGEERVAAILDRAESIGVTVIAIGELCTGFAKGSRLQKNLTDLEDFLGLPVVETLPVDRRVAEVFGEIVEDLRRKGRPVPVNDIRVAAASFCAGATLLTCNAHFRIIPRVGTLVMATRNRTSGT